MVQFQGKQKGKKAVAKPKKQVKPAPPPPKEESSNEEETVESEEEATEVVAKKPVKTPVKKAKKSVEVDDEDEKDVKEATNGKSKQAAGEQDENDEDEDLDDDDDEEEEDQPKAEVKSDSMEVDDGESEEDEEEEGDDDEEDDDDDDDDDEEEEEESEAPLKKGKRKQEGTETIPQKKQKTDSEGALITLLFSNLPERTTDAKFYKFLTSKGIKCKACRANYFKCKAFVDINSSDEEKALALDQVEWNDQAISVELATPRHQELKPKNEGADGNDNSERDAKTLFVKNLPFSVSEEDLKGIFDDVEEVRILTDRYTGKPKGIAFVQFKDPESVDKAMETKDSFELEGRQLAIDYTGSRSSKTKTTGGGPRNSTLYVKGIPEDMTKEDFSKYFEDASEVKIIADRETGKNKGFAYVSFESEDLAKKCFESSKAGIEVEDGSTTLEVDFAKDRRRDFGGRGGGFRGRGGRGGGFRGRGGRGGGFRGRGGRGRGFRGRGRGRGGA